MDTHKSVPLAVPKSLLRTFGGLSGPVSRITGQVQSQYFKFPITALIRHTSLQGSATLYGPIIAIEEFACLVYAKSTST